MSLSDDQLVRIKNLTDDDLVRKHRKDRSFLEKHLAAREEKMSANEISNARQRAQEWKPVMKVESTALSAPASTCVANPPPKPSNNPDLGDFAAAINLVIGFIGFLLFFFLAFGLEALLLAAFQELMGHRMRPFGLGWIAMPIAGGIAGWHLFRLMVVPWATKELPRLLSNNRWRIPIAVYCSWFLSYLIYMLITERYFSYWYRYHEDEFWLTLMSPPTVAMVVIFLFLWAFKKL